MVDSYKIIEAKIDTRYGDIPYFVVEFYSNNNLVCVEDFQMVNLQQTANVPVIDVDGNYILTNGEKLTLVEIKLAQDNYLNEIKNTIDENIILNARIKYLNPIDEKFKIVQKQIIPLDIKQQIIGNIERHIQTINNKNYTGDRRDKTLSENQKIDKGISKLKDVKDLIGINTKIIK